MTGYTRTEHLEASIAAKIKDGTLKPGDKIDSEAKLAEEYQVSRGTVRRALGLLKQARLIETRMGSGSYVAFHGSDLTGAAGWGTAMLRSGTPTVAETLSIALVDRPEALADDCEAERFYRIERRRRFRITPVSYEISYLPATPKLMGVIDHAGGLVGGSISKTMAAAGLRPSHGSVDVSADRLGPAADILEKSPDAVFLVSERRDFDGDDELVEYVRSFLDPSHFTVHIATGAERSEYGR